MNLPSSLLTLMSLALLSNVACAGKSEGPSAPTPTATTTVTASATVGLQAATSFTFPSNRDFEAGALAYRWEFGDGETSTEAAPAHIYSSLGARTVVLTVSNARQSSRSEMAVTIHTVTGRWVSTGGTTTMELTQSGSAITGQASVETGPGEIPYTQCAISGSVQVGTPAVIVLSQPPCAHPVFARLVPFEYRLNMAIDGQIISGTRVSAVTGTTAQIALRR